MHRGKVIRLGIAAALAFFLLAHLLPKLAGPLPAPAHAPVADNVAPAPTGAPEQQPEVDPIELQQLREATRPLASLRNEVAQLRRAKAESEALARENEALRSAQRATTFAMFDRFTQLHQPVARESWMDAGTSTPTSTVQTYFWATSRGDHERLAQCSEPGLPGPPESTSDRNTVATNLLGAISGYSVVQLEIPSAERALVNIEAYTSNGPVSLTLPLTRTGQGWKIPAPAPSEPLSSP